MTPTHSSTENTYSFSYTGQMQTFTVPFDCYLEITAAGASGGKYYNNGGKGDIVTAIFASTTGQVLYVLVGQNGISNGYCNTIGPTFGGGGGGYCGGGQGGGASDVRTVQNDCCQVLRICRLLSHRICSGHTVQEKMRHAHVQVGEKCVLVLILKV